jgi:hypothetical protein
MLCDLVSQDVSLMQNSRGMYSLCEHRSLVQKSGERTTSVSIDRLVQKSGGMYNLCEPSQAL